MLSHDQILLRSFPPLFKKTATGAIQFWTMSVNELLTETGSVGELVTTYGQHGTESPQTTRDLISEGKNLGKKNETTAVEQAIKEGEAQWLKKKKKGYVESIDSADSGAVDETVIEGGVLPMLAEKYAEQGHKIKFPCYGQPKFDGARCLAIVKNGKASLWTRSRKPIRSVPHIVSALEKVFPTEDIMLDGELYNHDLNEDFERLMSLIRKDEPGVGHTDVEYHIYDIVDLCLPFEKRVAMLEEFTLEKPLIHAKTEKLLTEDAVKDFFSKCLTDGYEGAMLRNADGLYANRRSTDLQKIKDLPDTGQSAEEDAEFPIIGIKGGRGKLRGHVGSFVCGLPNNKTFTVKLMGDQDRLKSFFENPDLWRGKDMVVRFQGYTKEDKPRFPRGLRLRDNIDY